MVPTMSRLSSGYCSSVCLRRLESGRGPLVASSRRNAVLKGSRMSCAAYSQVSNCRLTGSGSRGCCWGCCLGRLESGRGPLAASSRRNAVLRGSRMSCAAYSKVSNCCITGSGSSGGAGRALTLATHSSRLGASPGVLDTPRTQPANASASSVAAATRGKFIDIVRMSVRSPGGSPVGGGGRLRSGFLLVEVAIGLDRSGKLEARVGRDAGRRIAAARPQRNIVHGHDHHPRQRRHAADERAELVVAAHHLQLDRLLGVELLRRFRTGPEQLVVDAGRKRSLRDVIDQRRHLGAAGQL